jgi:hypothetical protein
MGVAGAVGVLVDTDAVLVAGVVTWIILASAVACAVPLIYVDANYGALAAGTLASTPIALGCGALALASGSILPLVSGLVVLSGLTLAPVCRQLGWQTESRTGLVAVAVSVTGLGLAGLR